MSSVNGLWITKKKRNRIYARDKYRCAYCGACGPDARLSLDHYKGRSNDASNLLTACLSCNSSKQGKSIRAWFAWLRKRDGINTNALRKRIARTLAKPLPEIVEHHGLTEGIDSRSGCGIEETSPVQEDRVCDRGHGSEPESQLQATV